MKKEAIEQMTVNEMTQAEWDILNKKIVAGLEYSELISDETHEGVKAARSLAEQWNNVAKQINSAHEAMRGSYEEAELLEIKAGETAEAFAKRREAARDAAKKAYDARVAEIMRGAPALFTGALTGPSSYL